MNTNFINHGINLFSELNAMQFLKAEPGEYYTTVVAH